MIEIKFTLEALNDLKEIKSYIIDELCSETAAVNTIGKITKRIRSLVDFLDIGASLDSVIHVETAYRYLVCGNYLAFYRYENNEVRIIRVLYSRRNYMQILFGESTEENKI